MEHLPRQITYLAGGFGIAHKGISTPAIIARPWQPITGNRQHRVGKHFGLPDVAHSATKTGATKTVVL